jgi:hypothetical protein
MNIMSKIPSTQTVITGRFSDGSDRQVQTVTIWTVELIDNGHRYRCTFDHDPTDAEIEAAPKEDVTSREDLLQKQIDDLNVAMAAVLGGAV